jgi:hypothetical protein
MINSLGDKSASKNTLRSSNLGGTGRIFGGETGAREVIVPLIRAAATIGFAIAPCSLGFVIIAVSEHLIRSIIVGDDPEMLMSDLQNQFPNNPLEIIENDDARLVAEVVDSIERPDRAIELPVDVICSNGGREAEISYRQ